MGKIMTSNQKQAMVELGLTLAALAVMFGLVLCAGCKTPPPAVPGGNAALTQINGQNVDGAAKALTAATTAATAARESNDKAVRAFAGVCASPELPPQIKPVTETGVKAAQETGKQLEAAQAELVKVKALGGAAVAGWAANEADYRKQIVELQRRLAAAEQAAADLKVELKSQYKWTWFLLIGACVLVVIAGTTMFGITKDILWLALSGGGVSGGIAIEVFKRVDALPNWYWVALVSTFVLGGAGLVAWQCNLSHKTPAADGDVPKVGDILITKLKSLLRIGTP